MLESDRTAMPERGDEDAAIRVAANRLEQAASSGTPCRPVRDLLGDDDISIAYRVQDLITKARIASGARVVGRKIGLTSPAVQKQLGVDQPDFGTLFADMDCPEGEPVPMDRLLQPRIEAEVAFVLGADLAEGDLDLPQVRDAVEYAVAALEIVDSRVADWDIAITDTIADNASSGGVVLGTRPVRLDAVDLALTGCLLHRNGELEQTGAGGAVLGSPLNALVWLANVLGERGVTLEAGHVVLPGSCTASIPVRPGDSVTATFGGIGSVSIAFAKEAA